MPQIYRKKGGLYIRKRNIGRKRFIGKSTQALKLARKALRALNSEVKWLDTINLALAITSTESIIPLTNIQQGVTSETRIGESLKLMSIHFRGQMFGDPAIAVSQVRLVLVQDMQTNGALYTNSDLFENVSANADLVTQRNLKNKHRFRILMDRTYSMQNTGNLCHDINFYQKLSMLIRYKSNNGDITDLSSNSLTLYAVSNRTTDAPDLNYSIRLRFVDN